MLNNPCKSIRREVVIRGIVKGHKEKSPTNPNRATITGYCPVDQIGLLMESGNVPWCDPRYGYVGDKDAKRSTYVAKEIRESLGTPNFHDRNLGIDLVAEEAILENGVLTVGFGFNPNKKRGVGNGGTTIMVVTDAITHGKTPFVQSDDPASKQYVKITVYIGDFSNEEVESMVEAWNTNRQVDKISMANFTGKFDWLCEQLEKSHQAWGPFPKVARFFGDSGAYNVEEIVQILCLFAMPDAAKTYSGVGGCLDFYTRDVFRKVGDGNKEVYAEKKESDSEIKSLFPLIHDILYLYEYVVAEIQGVYNTTGKGGTGGKFLSLSIIMDNLTPTHLPYINRDIPFTPYRGWHFPLVAAFRGALDRDNSPLRWKTDPFKLFQDIGAEVFNCIDETFKTNNNNFNKVGREKTLYLAVEGLVAKAADKAVRKAARFASA